MSSQQISSSISVAELNLYPIKSCRGHAIQASEIDARGFKHDRVFMLVDPLGSCLTQREYPAMALVVASVEVEALLELNAPDMPSLRVEYSTNGTWIDVDMWGTICKAIDQGERVADWFSTYLHTECRLVHIADDFVRPITDHSQGSFVDGYPFLILSDATLADLNSRLAEPVTMQSFRPSIVLRGTTPYAEDTWRGIRIGACEFEFIEPCKRCTLTTIDPASARRGKEPLRTLATYRRGPDGAVLLGQYAVHRQPGRIHVGDHVEILL